jgi:large subunit ribosomal protein L18
MNSQKTKEAQRRRRRFRVRNKVRGTAERPRLSVFRSSMHISAQLIDDDTGRTLASASSQVKREKAATGDHRTVKADDKGEARKKRKQLLAKQPYGGNVKAAKAIGLKLAQAAKAVGISKVAFDRGHYRYHGRVKALAEGAREGGLQF